MSLLPFRRPPEHPEPPAAALSPARKALQKNHDEASKQLARLDELAQPLRQLTLAQERLSIATDAVSAIEKLDQAQLATWGANPSGPMPPPIQRAAAVAELADAQAEVDRAKRVWDVVSPGWRKEESALHLISLARPALASAVLIEAARQAVERRRQAFRDLSASGGQIEGILATLRKAGDDAGQVEVTRIIRGGDRLDDAAFHDRTLKHGQIVRDAWAEMHGRLLNDPAATVEVEPADPNNGGDAA